MQVGAGTSGGTIIEMESYNTFVAFLSLSFSIRTSVGIGENCCIYIQLDSLVHSHWSRNVEAWLSLVERIIVLPLLCHKEPARRIQSPLLGALERKIPPLGGILLAPRWFFMA